MDGFSSSKFTQVVIPESFSVFAEADSAIIDTNGFLYAHFTVAAGGAAGTAVPVQIESSATSGGTYADIVGAVVTTAPDGMQTIAVRLDASTSLGFVRVKAAAVTGAAVVLSVTCMLTNAANSVNYASTPTVTV